MTRVVILAAGWGTRMRPLTHTRPKPAIKIAGKTLIEHNLSQLTGLVEEAIIVIGYKGDIIKKEIGDEFKGIKVRYAKQEEPIGTGDAARSALPFLEDDFLILNGDDLYKRKDLESCLEKNPTIMVKEVDNPSGFGQIVCEDGQVTDLVEKPDNNVSNLVNIGAYYVNKSFFETDIEKSERGEFEITDYIKDYIKNHEVNFHVAESWDPVSYPWNILESTDHIFDDYAVRVDGSVEEGVRLRGKVIIEEGATVKAGTRIEGPVYIGAGCVIGPNSFIGPYSSLGEGVEIGHGVEIKNSVIGKGVKMPYFCYLSDSVLGQDCSLGAGTIAANTRFDKSVIKTKVKGEVVSARRKKLGAILGDGVKTGINVSLMPGVMIGAESTIHPHSIVKKNIKKATTFKL